MASRVRAKHTIMSPTERVDRAGKLQTQIKPLEKELKSLKDLIRMDMDNNDWKTIEGVSYEALLSGGTTSVIDPYQLYQLLKEKNQLAKFWDCISVKVKDAKEGLADVVTIKELDDLKTEVETTKRLSIREK